MVAGNMSDKLISIHAPREGGDAVRRDPGQYQHISIHAPREGGDVVAANQNSQPKDFNPRPPRGGRR